jgi:hypothetical protein
VAEGAVSSDTIATVASLIVGGIVLVVLAFCAIVFWSAWQKGERRKQKGVSADKAGRAQARPGKRRKK